MSQRRAMTKTIATRYRRASKAGKGVILVEPCATTGWHRNHARKALGRALGAAVVLRQPRPCPAVYGPASRYGTGILLGGAGRPDRVAARTGAGQSGAPAAPLRNHGQQLARIRSRVNDPGYARILT